MDGVFAVWVPRDVVRVAGPDARSFLQGQLSQDVDAVAVGGSAWSLILQPQGKVDAFVRVAKLADDELTLDTDGGWGDRVVERLQRFKLRVKADIDLLDWRCLALRGEGASLAALESSVAPASGADTLLVLDATWHGRPGVDVLGAAPTVPEGVAVAGLGAFELERIEMGMPKMGTELDERTIPAEAGVVDASVSFTKGCYTGQELVARIDSRGGNVPRHLRRIAISGAAPPPGSTLHDGTGKEVGVLTSVAATGAGAVALAYVGRAVEVPADLEVRAPDGGVVARAAVTSLG